mgnify:CR=1 FL=1
MAEITLAEVLAEVTRLRAKLTIWCREVRASYPTIPRAERECLRAATLEVEWSDRMVHTCADHEAAARMSAANDGIGDRTLNPRVSVCSQDADALDVYPDDGT